MRILGLDLGTKTLGVSVSDLTETIASGVKTIRFEDEKYENCLKELKEIIDYYNIKIVVLGLPLNMNNTRGDAVLRTENFKKLLEENFDIKVYYQDERLSSVTANNILIEANISRKKRKNKVDKLASIVILQNYLDKRKKDQNG